MSEIGKLYSFDEVKQILRISQSQFDKLDKLDGKDGKISESIFKSAFNLRVEKQGCDYKPTWQKQEHEEVLHTILDEDFTDWEKPKNLQFTNLNIKTTEKQMPDNIQKSLQQYMKDLLRVYQTTGKFDSESVTTMIPANMKISISNQSKLIYKEDNDNSDKNDYSEKTKEGTIHHKNPDGILIVINYYWTDSNTGKKYSGVGVLRADTTS